MPTKLAVSSATPSERGPTSDSCSRVLRQWILPVVLQVHGSRAAPARSVLGCKNEPPALSCSHARAELTTGHMQA